MKIFPKRLSPPGNPSRFIFWRWMTITDMEGEPYLTRLYVFRCPKFGINLHWIHRHDWEREVHSHPWGTTKRTSFWSFVVKGGYTEELATVREDSLAWRPDGEPTFFLADHRTKTWGRGWHAFGINDVHRISSVKPGTVTLVVHGKKRSGWGFWSEEQQRLVPWREWLAERDHPQATQ